MTERPQALPPQWHVIPAELKELRQWVNWRYEWVTNSQGVGHWTKPPYGPGGEAASPSDTATWSPYDEVRLAYLAGGFDGVGFALSLSGPYCAFDFDHVLGRRLRIIVLGVARYVQLLNSHTERSPGGDGLHTIVKAKVPAGRRQKRPAHVELYSSMRYVTISGQVWGPAKPIAERQSEVDVIHAELFAAAEEDGAGRVSSSCVYSLDDAQLLDRMRNARNGGKFIALFDHGDWGSLGFASQ
jgi:primase-polymerase (primpol)-like protein